MRIHGHENLVKNLEDTFYNTILLEGEPHIGKTTVAKHVAKFHGRGVISDHFLLTAERARLLADLMTYRKYVAFIVSLDGSLDIAQNVLLKSIEEIDQSNMVILTGKPGYAIPTLRSRMQYVAQLTPLKEADVVAILRQRGVPVDDAERQGKLSHGTLQKAWDNVAEERNLVVRALKAIHDHDSAALDNLATKWTDETTEYLKYWCTEAITKQWRLFSAEDSLFSGVQMPLAILIAISHNIRPKLVVRSSLMGLI